MGKVPAVCQGACGRGTDSGGGVGGLGGEEGSEEKEIVGLDMKDE